MRVIGAAVALGLEQAYAAFDDLLADPGVEVAADTPNPLVPTFADGHRGVLVCEGILRSHREQGWEVVDR